MASTSDSNQAKSSAGTKPNPMKGKPINQEQVIQGFNLLRHEQRQLANKIVELECDVNEHNLVLEALKNVDDDRKCWRMIGGILVQRTVKDVRPALEKNKDMIEQLITKLKEQVVEKGKEIADYMEQYKISIQRGEPPAPDSKVAEEQSSNQQGTSSVLVSDSS